MSITFSTNAPQALLNDFKKKIDGGEIVTWRYDAQGDFTHCTDQWDGRGWLRPTIGLNELRFNFVGSRGYVTTWPIYGIFQGRFIESMITHCHDLFSTGSATSKPTNSDIITSQAA